MHLSLIRFWCVPVCKVSQTMLRHHKTRTQLIVLAIEYRCTKFLFLTVILTLNLHYQYQLMQSTERILAIPRTDPLLFLKFSKSYSTYRFNKANILKTVYFQTFSY